MNKEIPKGLARKVRKWLGDDGIAFFEGLLKEHGKLNVVIGEGSIPHPVHFREGMQVRNFMRSSGFCKGWDDHDFDNNWEEAVKAALGQDGDPEPKKSRLDMLEP